MKKLNLIVYLRFFLFVMLMLACCSCKSSDSPSPDPCDRGDLVFGNVIPRPYTDGEVSNWNKFDETGTCNTTKYHFDTTVWQDFCIQYCNSSGSAVYNLLDKNNNIVWTHAFSGNGMESVGSLDYNSRYLITVTDSGNGKFRLARGHNFHNRNGCYVFDYVTDGCDSDGGSNGNAGTDPGGTGDISMTLTWSWSNSSRTEGPDIDMWVTDPNGHTLSTSRNDYSLGPCPDGGQIDFDDLGGWGDGDGGGPERAFWPTGSAPSGTYTYGVRYYQGDGTANYTLKVYKGTTLYTTKTGTLTVVGSAITLDTVTK